MVYGIEMSLPIIVMLTCIEVAGPDIHVLENSLRVYLMKQK